MIFIILLQYFSMFILNSQIPQVKDFKFSKFGLALIIGEQPAFKLSLDGTLVDTFSMEKANPIFIEFENFIIYSSFYGECYEINLTNSSQRRINENHKPISVIDNQGTDFLMTTNDGNAHSEIIDIKTLETKHEFQTLTGQALFATKFYYTVFQVYGKIICLSADTYKQLWEFDVSEIGKWINSRGEQLGGEVVKIIGEWNDLLLIHVTCNKILAINSSGILEWEIDNFLLSEEQLNFPYTKRSDMVTTVRWLLDSQQGKLYLLGSHYLFEFDLQSRERKTLKDYSADATWLFKAGKLHENYILFSGFKYWSGIPDQIGIIDLSRNEIIWEYKIEGGGFFISYPVMHKDRIYIKDNKDVLYEFKRE